METTIDYRERYLDVARRQMMKAEIAFKKGVRVARLVEQVRIACARADAYLVNRQTEAWNNAAMAKEAQELTLRDLGKEESRVWDGDNIDVIHEQGPSHLPDAKELYRMLYSMKRAERRQMLDTPPGVGI